MSRSMQADRPNDPAAAPLLQPPDQRGFILKKMATPASRPTRASVFRTSDWGGSESPSWNWDYAEVDDPAAADGSTLDRLSVGGGGGGGGGSRRNTNYRCSSTGNPYEWDYHEITPQNNSWDCRNLPRMQIRCYVRMLTEEGTVGNFIIRRKQDDSGYALTLKSNQQGDFLTYLIEPLPDGAPGFGIRGCDDDEVFPTIEELVRFYSAERRQSIGIQLKAPVELWPSTEFFQNVGMAAIARGQPPAAKRASTLQKRPSTSLSSPGGDSKRRRSARNPADLSAALFGWLSTAEEEAVDPRDVEVDEYIAVGASYGMPAIKVVEHTFETEPTLDELSRMAILADNKILALQLDGNNPTSKLASPDADNVDAAALPTIRARAPLRRGVPQPIVQACGVADWPGKVIPFPNASVGSEYSASFV